MKKKIEGIEYRLKESRADKNVLSISLGSSMRDSQREIEIAGIRVGMFRMGCDGNFELAKALLEKFDGDPRISAFGLGGIDLWIGKRRYIPKHAASLVKNIKKTPFFDGWGLKDTLERKAIQYLQRTFPLKGEKVLIVSGIDRFGIAEELERNGCQVTYGDIMFTCNLPIPIGSLSLRFLDLMTGLALKIGKRLPLDAGYYSRFYPVGKEQEKNTPRFKRTFDKVDIVAGDFLYIKRYMPLDLQGKIIITNTTTEEEVGILKSRSVSYLITTTPRINGRTFGTNVMEAAFASVLQEKDDLKNYEDILRVIDYKPEILKLQESHGYKQDIDHFAICRGRS